MSVKTLLYILKSAIDKASVLFKSSYLDLPIYLISYDVELLIVLDIIIDSSTIPLTHIFHIPLESIDQIK